MITCGNCALAKFKDFGYSNYTVEGTTFTCRGNYHPDGEFDRWYGAEKRLGYAQVCAHFREGEPLYLAVEDEDIE